MGVNITAIPLGAGNCYIVRDKGTIIVDCGVPKKAKAFKKAMEKNSIKPEEVQLIVITHGHWDHIGSAKDIKEITGARIAMHANEREWLEKSLKQLPAGVTAWGRILKGIMGLFMPLVYIPPVDVDIELGDEVFSLSEYGIPGKVLYTPGHSSGSVSVLLETGDAFVGDLAMNMFPLRFTPGLPIFADDLDTVKESWNLLLEQGAQTIYPGHGKPFSADIFRKVLSEDN
jgi:hydroxyacylglutathione hydrolase